MSKMFVIISPTPNEYHATSTHIPTTPSTAVKIAILVIIYFFTSAIESRDVSVLEDTCPILFIHSPT